jgi:hypothetical protein
MLAKIGDTPEADGLADALAPGRARFFRGFIGWRERRSRRRRGPIGRVIDAAARPAIPAAERAGDLVVSPLRKVASAPLAVAGAISSRLYLLAGRGK